MSSHKKQPFEILSTLSLQTRDCVTMARTEQQVEEAGRSVESDTTVIVGGVEFNEYSQHLSAWSDYFDKALSSGMKEATSKRFEFAHRSPKEWETIKSMLTPFATYTVGFENVSFLVSWFDELCSPKGLSICDLFLSKTVTAFNSTHWPSGNFGLQRICQLMEIMVILSKHSEGLPLTKNATLKLVNGTEHGSLHQLHALLGP